MPSITSMVRTAAVVAQLSLTATAGAQQPNSGVLPNPSSLEPNRFVAILSPWEVKAGGNWKEVERAVVRGVAYVGFGGLRFMECPDAAGLEGLYRTRQGILGPSSHRGSDALRPSYRLTPQDVVTAPSNEHLSYINFERQTQAEWVGQIHGAKYRKVIVGGVEELDASGADGITADIAFRASPVPGRPTCPGDTREAERHAAPDRTEVVSARTREEFLAALPERYQFPTERVNMIRFFNRIAESPIAATHHPACLALQTVREAMARRQTVAIYEELAGDPEFTAPCRK